MTVRLLFCTALNVIDQASGAGREMMTMRSNIQQDRVRLNVAPTETFPSYFTVTEIAQILRTTKPAVYQMAARGQIPGVTHVGRRLLFHAASVLNWLNQNRAPSPKESR